MNQFFQNIVSNIGVNDVLDILIVAFLFYKLLGFIRETRAEQLAKGLLVLVLVALGCLQRSGLMSRGRGYRDRVALRVSLSFMIIYVVIICLLTLMPHAILLSVTGSLFPSAFSRALVPIICFGIGVLSISFGMVSGRLHTLTDILDALTFGLQQGAPLIILYIMFFQFYASLLFVFG